MKVTLFVKIDIAKTTKKQNKNMSISNIIKMLKTSKILRSLCCLAFSIFFLTSIFSNYSSYTYMTLAEHLIDNPEKNITP